MPDRLMYFTVRCLGRHFCPLFLNFLVDQVWQCAYLVPLNSLLLFLSHVIEDGLYFGFFLMCLLGAWLASRVHFSDRALFYTSNTFCLSCSLLMAVKCLWFKKKKKACNQIPKPPRRRQRKCTKRIESPSLHLWLHCGACVGPWLGRQVTEHCSGKGFLQRTRSSPVYRSRYVEQCLVSSGLRYLKLMASVSSKETRLFNCLR